jgi:enamine deaminase RidA (YjgF/YER057c/UK114 family)
VETCEVIARLKKGSWDMNQGRGRSKTWDAVVPTAWTDFYEATHIPAAVRVGDTIRLTGHTGDGADGTFSDDPEDQTRQTFRNIADTLAEAGASWSDVVEVTSYRVGLREHSDALLRVAAEFLEAPYPAWTDVGVTELFEPEAVVEISCIALVPTATPDTR